MLIEEFSVSYPNFTPELYLSILREENGVGFDVSVYDSVGV